jgi:hypothetical protein
MGVDPLPADSFDRAFARGTALARKAHDLLFVRQWIRIAPAADSRRCKVPARQGRIRRHAGVDGVAALLEDVSPMRLAR